jgi:hypothetical protein
MQPQRLLQHPPFNPSQICVAEIRVWASPISRTTLWSTVRWWVYHCRLHIHGSRQFHQTSAVYSNQGRTIFLRPYLLSRKHPGTHLSLCRLTLGIPTTQHANSGDSSGIVVHSGRKFCSRRDGTHQSILGHLSLPPVGSLNTHPSLQRHLTVTLVVFRRQCTTLSTSTIHCIPIQSWRYYRSANSGSEHAFEPSTPPWLVHHDHHPSLPPTFSASQPHSLRIVAKDPCPQKPRRQRASFDSDDDKLYCFCGNYQSG